MSAKTERKEKTEGLKVVLSFLKSIFISLIITFASVILFAFIIKWASLGDGIIAPVNLVIKGLSVFVGALIFCRSKSRGILKGGLYGVIYTIISFSIFSILAGAFEIGLGLISDFAFNIIIGAIAGVLGVNIKSKR